MRITLISPNLPPTLCGIGDYTANLASALANLGAQVSIITSSCDCTPIPKVDIRQVVTSWSDLAIPAVVRVVREIRPDVVLWQYNPFMYGYKGLSLGYSWLPTLLTVGVGCKVLPVLHEMYMPSTTPGLKGMAWRFGQRAQFFLLQNGSAGAVVTTKERQYRLRQLFPRLRTWKIPVGSNLPVVSVSAVAKDALRARLGLSSDSITMGLFGGLHPERDFETAIRGTAKLRARGIDAHLVCVGPTLPEFRHRELASLADFLHIERQIHWLGALPPEQAACILTSLDVYLILQTDGASARRTSLVAGLAFGMPIIAASGSANYNGLEHNRHLLYIPQKDSEGLMTAMLEIAPDLRRRDYLGTNARALYQTDFAWPVIARKVFNACLTVASKR